MERTTSGERRKVLKEYVWIDEAGVEQPVYVGEEMFSDPTVPGSKAVRRGCKYKEVIRLTPPDGDIQPRMNTESSGAAATTEQDLPKLDVFGNKGSVPYKQMNGEHDLPEVANDNDDELELELDDEPSKNEYPSTFVMGTGADETTENEGAERLKRPFEKKSIVRALGMVGVGATVGLGVLYGVSVVGTSHVTEGTVVPSFGQFVVDLIPGNDT